MNGTITSKNFRAEFRVTLDYHGDEIFFTGLSSEARKFIKREDKNSGRLESDLPGIVLILNSYEAQLREYVLAKIGG